MAVTVAVKALPGSFYGLRRFALFPGAANAS